MHRIDDVGELASVCREVRRDILLMVYNAGSGHIGGSFSATELLVTLFFNAMNHDPEHLADKTRDRFILSKGHCTPAYYAVLAHTGYFDPDELLNFRKINSRLQDILIRVNFH